MIFGTHVSGPPPGAKDRLIAGWRKNMEGGPAREPGNRRREAQAFLERGMER